jgi:cytochrome c biogenesis protein CcmG, thiol:disulfide interchange protein DsbE
MTVFDSMGRSPDVAGPLSARCLLSATAALLLLGWCSLACAATEGQPAPSIQAKLLDGTVFNLADDKGKVVIVNMWATWCGPCREEMPALDAYYRQHRDQGLVLVALSMDDPRDEAKVRAATQAYSFPVGLERETYLKGYGRIWRLPMTFVVDRRGILRKDQWYGDPGLDAKLLEQTVTPLLGAP